jgi:mRNA interferase MazF
MQALNIQNFNFQNPILSNFETLQGDIFLADFGEGIGSEQSNVRPCVIMSNNINNKHSPTITVVPITSKLRNQPTRANINNNCLYRESQAAAEQIRTIDKKRLLKFMGELDKITLKKIKEAIKTQMDILN